MLRSRGVASDCSSLRTPLYSVYADEWESLYYADTGRTEPKMCSVLGEPPTSYTCSRSEFWRAIGQQQQKGDEDKADPRALAAWAVRES